MNDSYCQDIDEHFPDDWNNLTSIQVIFCVLYCLVFVTSLAGNGLILCTVITTRRLQTTRNLFVSNLALADSLMVLFCLPLTVYALIKKVWVFGSVLCHAMPYFQAFTVVVAGASLSVVALDRYLLIVNPHGLRSINRGCATFILPIIWVVAAGFCSPVAAFQKLVSGSALEMLLCDEFCVEEWPSGNVSHAYFGALLTVQYVLPVIITSFCYIELSRKANRSQVVSRKSSNMDKRVVAARKMARMNKILTTIVVAYSLGWLPQNLLNVLRDCEVLPTIISHQEYFFSLICHFCSMMPSVCNPLLYLACNEEFRMHALRRNMSSAVSLDTESHIEPAAIRKRGLACGSSRIRVSAAVSFVDEDDEHKNTNETVVFLSLNTRL